MSISSNDDQKMSSSALLTFSKGELISAAIARSLIEDFEIDPEEALEMGHDIYISGCIDYGMDGLHEGIDQYMENLPDEEEVEEDK